MKKIRVLGTGCPKCEKLYNDVQTTAKELGLDYELEKISEVSQMMQYGVMTTPALVVDGEVKAAGKAPSAAELRKLLS